VYAGAGLAVLYFGVLARRYAQLHATMGADGCVLGPSQRSARHSRWRRELRLALGGGVLFYVLVPLGLYLAAYLPYRAGNASFGLREWWACQLSMFRYHSTLDATHPFSSSWYAWLGDLRPVWYYQGKGLAAGQYASIAGFVSPVLAWCGLAAILWLLARQAGARGTAAGGFVLVCYGSNLLPWLLVTRCTFLYHYFPCLPSLAAAIALALNALAHKNERGLLYFIRRRAAKICYAIFGKNRLTCADFCDKMKKTRRADRRPHGNERRARCPCLANGSQPGCLQRRWP
jgi:hypothetical protein